MQLNSIFVVVTTKAIIMKKKFKTLLSEKTKDMGLSDKAVDELVELGVIGLADNASDDDITAKVNSIVPFAKSMQAEYTRKVQEAKQSLQHSTEEEGKKGGEGDTTNQLQKLLDDYKKTFEERMTTLETENQTLKAAKLKEAREAQISAKAKELGIPDFMMKRFSVADDADYVKELTDFKQELVNNKLMPESAAGEQGNKTQAMAEAAKAWAQSLPNK